jgi:hypothetical protein
VDAGLPTCAVEIWGAISAAREVECLGWADADQRTVRIIPD